MIHKLKILPEFFPLVEKGKKRFELRKNDRNYQEDDILLLQEYFDGEYTGRQCVVKITNVFGSNNEESLWPELKKDTIISCLLYTSPSPRDLSTSRMPSSA